MYPNLCPQDAGCRTTFCPHCQSTDFKRHGNFTRKSDGHSVQRFLCALCQRTFSRAGYSFLYRQGRRRDTELIRVLLTSGVSQRGVARVLKIDKDTVARRLLILGKLARYRHMQALDTGPEATHVQIDDLITLEHTKMKPVSITVISDAERYRILGFRVSRIPANGLLAEKSREKYGPRPDESTANRAKVMSRCCSAIHPEAIVVSDEHSAYPPLVKRFLPKALHVRHLGAKGSTTGQGELKKLGFDPLFCINHQFAMCRANISRLIRKTWNTTKRIECLEAHFWIFVDEYNRHRRPADAVEQERYLEHVGQLLAG